MNGRVEPSDEGAVLVWAGVMLAVLLGVGALVIDIGAVYLERRELQNGADAAALAVAKGCAGGDCSGETSTAARLADDLADGNANDGAATVDLVCGDGPGLSRAGCAEPSGLDGASGWVRVETSTDNPANADDEGRIGYVLAPLVGAADGGTVTASASAAWGPVDTIETLPLAMSTCALTTDRGPPSVGDLPDGDPHVYFHGRDRDQSHADDCGFESGLPDWPWLEWVWREHRLGVAWLAGSDDCTLDVQAGVELAAGPDGADPDDVDCHDPESWLGETKIVPIYDRTYDPPDGPRVYRIVGFAGFRITEYRLEGESSGGPSCPWWWPGCDGGLYRRWYIEGEFTPITTLATTSGGSFGDAADYGVRTVQLVG